MIWCDQRWHPVVMCRSWCLLPSSSFGPCISVPPLNQIWQAPRASTCKTITGNWSTHCTESVVVMCTSLLTWALLLIVNTLLSRQAWKHSRCLIGVLIIIMLHLWVCRQLSGSKRELLSDGAAFFSGPFLRLPILIGEIYASSLNHCIRQSVNIWVVKKKKPTLPLVIKMIPPICLTVTEQVITSHRSASAPADLTCTLLWWAGFCLRCWLQSVGGFCYPVFPFPTSRECDIPPTACLLLPASVTRSIWSTTGHMHTFKKAECRLAVKLHWIK